MQWQSLHDLLKDIYAGFLPRAADLIAVGRAIAGLGAILYISHRIWQNMASNEPIDFYPLFRPFVIAFFIGIYPAFITGINSVCEPVVAATEKLVGTSNQDISAYQKAKDDALKKLAAKNNELYLVDDAEYEKKLKDLDIVDSELYTTVFEKAKYDIKQSFSNILFNILEFLYRAVSLVVDAMRTFFLIVLVMIGPISMGISVWDGFKDTLQHWAARYIQIFLWLPIANILGAIVAQIQVLMLKNAIDEINSTSSVYSMDAFSGGDLAYMIFLLIAIVGYTTIPTLSGYVLQSCGAGGALRSFNRNASNVTNMAGAAGGAIAGKGAQVTKDVGTRAARGAYNIARMPYDIYKGYKGKR
jgi:conjugative transposon TraJ protein